MKCPNLKQRWKTIGYDEDADRHLETETAQFQDCIGDQCGYYDEAKNCCVVKVIAKELSRIHVKGISVQVAR